MKKASLALVFVTLFMVGCSTLNKESQQSLFAAASAAKELSLGFALLQNTFVQDDQAVKDYIKNHVDGMMLEAKALADIASASQLGSLRNATKRQIISVAENARAREENFFQMRNKLQLKPGSNVDTKVWVEWIQAHESNLVRVANLMELLASKLETNNVSTK
jgi:hypothetical protein